MSYVEAIKPVVRHLLQLGAGVLIARGIFTENEVGLVLPHLDLLIGSLITVGSLFWMNRDKKKEKDILKNIVNNKKME